MSWGVWIWIDERDGKRWEVSMAPKDVMENRWMIGFSNAETTTPLSVVFSSQGGMPSDLETQALLDRARKLGDR